MASLVIRISGTAPWEVELEGKESTVGRSPDCDIVLDEDGVSREHARFLMGGGRVVVEDLESRNGTFVNEERVERRALRTGDRVRLGATVELDFTGDEPAAARGAGRRGAGRGSAGRATARGARGAPGGGGGPLFRTEWVLIPEEPEGASQPIVLRSRVTTIGRKGSAAEAIEDDSISRMHARLDREEDQLYVSDLKSRNGTLVNDEPVMRQALTPGDVVTFGSLPFRVGRRRIFAWERLALGVGGLVVLAGLVFGAIQFSSWYDQKQRLARESARLKAEAIQSIERGIEASRQGDADFARGYFLNAADMLLYLNLAPPGASLSKPADIFRNVANELPPDARSFDFDAAFTQAAAGLEDLPNKEFVTRRVRGICIELGLGQEIQDGFVDQVWGFVDRFATHPRSFQPILDRAPRIHPQLRAALTAAHLPDVFCYVSWQESALRPDVTSPAGARGLWQFMPGTARDYGLRVDGGVDERTDPVRSTQAATKMIGDLLKEIGREQFMCALASYNWGPAAVRRALRKINDPMMPSSQKYWFLVENGLIPRETSEYVARIFANMIVAEAPERFGLRRPPGW
ncbi:MAG: FHA domain-containing protein [Candidatus Eisenbacteria bacterium]